MFLVFFIFFLFDPFCSRFFKFLYFFGCLIFFFFFALVLFMSCFWVKLGFSVLFMVEPMILGQPCQVG